MKNRVLFLLAAVLFTVISCKDKQSNILDTNNLFKFKAYISSHTFGKKSIAEPIRIELTKPLEQFEITQEIPSDYIKISPKTEGKLLIENGRSLVFQPLEYLFPGTDYRVTIKLDELYKGVASEFKNFTFSFQTIAPNFKVTLGNLQSHSKEWQYITGSIETSDVISFKHAKKLIDASQNDQNLPIEWEVDEGYATYYNFTIDSIQRTIEDDELLIKWSGKSIGADENKGQSTFSIPGQNNFKVVGIKTSLAPQAQLAVNFSDPLDPNQNFSGLVTLEKAQDLRYEVDGNVLSIYPANRIIGDVRLTVFNGVKNTEGFKLKNVFDELVSFEQLKPAVRLLSKGTILPNAVSTPLYFEAVNLSAVDVRVIQVYEENMLQFLQTSNINDNNSYELRRVGRRIAKKTISLQENSVGENGLWKAYAVDLSEIFESDPGAMYRVEISYKKSYSTYDCELVVRDDVINADEEQYDYQNETAELTASELDEREEQYWDGELYSWRQNVYNWRQEENPCHIAYYNQNKVIATNVLGSDIGLIVKKGNNRSYHFAVNNLLTTDPEAGVKIKLYNYQQQLIETVTTDSEGITLYDSNRNIAFAVAQKGTNYAYAKLLDGNSLSMSSFDVSGKQLEKGLQGFIYTDRGVHRPGDSIHLTFALNDSANPLPKNHPVTLSVSDARGKIVQRTVLNGTDNSSAGAHQNEMSFPTGKAINGFYYFPIPTDANAPAGNWNASIAVGGVQFNKQLKVATVKPNRLKIKLDFENKILDASSPIEGTVSGNWLHGAPARSLQVEMDMTLRTSNTAFTKFPDYVFNDPVRNFDEVEIPIVKKQLSAEGVTSFSKKIELSNKAPGMLKATFLTKIFEGGGDFSIDVFSKDLSPYSHFVGLRSPEAHRYGSYYTDENTVFDVASVDAQGKAAGGRELAVKVFKIEWRWWWNRGNDNLSRYENASVHRPVEDFTITTNAQGKANFTLNIPEKEAGRYLIRVIDKESGHATGRITYFYRNWWKAPMDAESTKMLVFSSDKEKYKVGEEAIITFPSGSEGRALISVENGTEVLATHWIQTKKGETKAAIKLTPEMAPNIYVNISLLQPHEQTKNDLPIRLYGVVPILVEDPSTVLKPKISMPEVLKPEKKFTVAVSETNNKPMTYTIAMVDEGLLDLTRFSTPEIHDAFYARQALGVKTFDMYDYVIGAYSGSVDNIYAVGGGDAAAGAKNRKADRFKPVVKFLGPFNLGASEKASHTINMPNYVGSVRTMIIAGDHKNTAYGSAEKTTPVRKPLMVLASLPRVLAPGEKVTVPVTVFAMEERVKNVTLNLKVSEALKPIDGTSKSVSFSEIGEKIINFEFEVLPTDEFQTIEVSANGNGETANYQLEVDVENPNPISQKVTNFTVSENASENINFETFGISGTNEATIELSSLPPMDFSRRMEYLIRYPHGCIEQTTSGAFPQLYLADIFDITFEKKNEIQENIEAAIQKLNSFQSANGGLSYWPGEREVDDWSTNYAGHFMLEAKSKGYALPLTFLNNWLRYQKNQARQWRNNNTRYNQSLTQAYRLYTLALAGQPELAAMNRLRESNQMSNDAKWRLAAAYALAGKTDVAQQIAQSANSTFKPKSYDHFTYGSPFRNKAMALETMVAIGDSQQREMAVSVAKELSSQQWYSTQETAYGLLAMAKMVEKNGGKALEVSITGTDGKSKKIQTERAVAQRDLDLAMGSNSISVSNKRENIVYVTLSQRGKLPLGKELAERRNLVMQSQYLDGEGKTLDISTLRQGTEITAKVTVTNSSNDHIEHLALTKIFPGGWEIVNTSFTSLGGGTSGNARYTDIRDDRVQFYFALEAKETKTFTVKLNASYLGTYYLPGTQVEAMYDNNYYARNKGTWVEVIQ